MQPKYTHSKSNIIKVTEDAKRKSRQRLIGSIILLFLALIVLLNVTAKVKPIPISPDVVEINNTAESKAASTTLMVKNSAANVAQISTESLTLTTMPAKDASSAAATKSPRALATHISSPKPASLPIIDKPHKAPAKTAKANPEDILDGLVAEDLGKRVVAGINNSPTKTSYIQFAALKNPEKSNALQQSLHSQGINAVIQKINTANGTLYRLRAGPYTNTEAAEKLRKIAANGYSGIIVSK